MHDISDYGPFKSRLLVGKMWFLVDANRWLVVAVLATPSVCLDPFPTINLEAFACATPVVTTKFGGAKELVSNGENGYVVNPLDVNEFASAIQALVTNPGRAAEFGAAGRRRAESKFEISDMTDRNLAVLRSMTAHSPV